MYKKGYFLMSTAAAVSIALIPLSVLAASEGMSESHAISKIRRTDEGGLKPHVGLMAGYLGEMGDASSQDGSALVEAGIQPLPQIETTAQFQHSPGSISTPGNKINYNVTDILLKVAYNFGGSMPIIRDSYVGAKSGAVMNTIDSETTTYFSAGGVLGFDIPLDLTSNVSLGAEASYLAIIGENTRDQASVLGAMKYWF